MSAALAGLAGLARALLAPARANEPLRAGEQEELPLRSPVRLSRTQREALSVQHQLHAVGRRSERVRSADLRAQLG